MKHSISTVFGTSEITNVRDTLDIPVPAAWVTISSPIIEALGKQECDIHFKNYISKSELQMSAFRSVDDNNLGKTDLKCRTMKEVVAALQSWIDV